jgi:uncharacterized membrane protein (UPF0127 family)
MRLWTIIAAIIISLSGLSLAIYPTISHRFWPDAGVRLKPTTTLQIANHRFQAVIATTPNEQAQGLAGVTEIGPDQAMYFPLDNQPNVTFWMKDMVIPIDIIWVAQGHIVGINANVPPPAPNTSTDHLVRYNSPVSALDGVIETAANRSRQLGLKAGDNVAIQP